MSLEGHVAVILGGTSGLGRALALGFAKSGAAVVATGRRVDRVERVAAEIEELGRPSLRMAADVTDRPSLERLRAATVEKFGKVDVLVNCAGKIKRGPTLDFPEDDWAEIVETNLTGTLRGCQVFGRCMLDRGYGRIVNVASLNSFVALSEVAAYGASKAGVLALTRSLAVEWGWRGVCVNAIAPGIFRTDLNEHLLDGTPRGRELLLRTPMKRFGRLEEVVGAALFLGSPSASFVNGQAIVIDGGFLASGVNQ
ncbi:MAG TPA: SDR family oxidoreductase [Polyangiaceae bacterium]|nr:SDR family oxidoreductase [Polyangiaceae bacterium]